MPYVVLEKLHKRFAEVTAIEEIDVSLEAGEFLSLLGPSGCGKTTALRIVAGFERPTTGRVVVDGKDVTEVPPNRRDMGMVFQAYSLFPNMNAEDNVEFGLRVRGRPAGERKRRVAELISDVSTGRVDSLPIGLQVTARVPAAGTRLLSLGERPAPEGADPTTSNDV